MEENKPSDNLINSCSDTNLINDVQDNLNTLTLNESSQEETDIKMTNTNDKTEEIIPTKTISAPVRVLPCRNIPEKIIICLDTCTDTEYTPFKIGDGTTFAPLYMLKRIIDIFVQNKNFIDTRHEFALLKLDSTDVKWIKDFTNNPSDIINSLKDISECEPNEEEFKLSHILDTIWENVNIPKPNNDLTILPPYVVRLILLYNRSNSSPIITENYEEILKNPYFTIDVILTHEEKPAEKYHEIFNNLQKLDDKGYSYKFEVGRNVTMLHDCMAKLLSHPLQRPTQTIASYDYNPERKKMEKEDVS